MAGAASVVKNSAEVAGDAAAVAARVSGGVRRAVESVTGPAAPP